MKFETALTALAMVIIGGIAIWYVFGGVIIEMMTTLVNVL